MGQNASSMSSQRRISKEELLYMAAINGNVEAVKNLCREGASLEWIDQDGKTPLIVACMNHGLFNTAKTLIELGANINAYRPGRNAGTPLHHAAKRGMDDIVGLLLRKGANALLMNDDCQTPLDIARAKGVTNVVRIIENHICYFSGWIRELLVPGFLEALAPQLLSRKIWAVVLPCASNSLKNPKMELVIYNGTQEPQPRSIIRLWKAKVETPKFDQADPTLKIVDKATGTRYKLAAAMDGDKHQMQSFFNACVGIPQSVTLAAHSTQASAESTQGDAEAAELAMAISASIQSASLERPSIPSDGHHLPEASTNGWGTSLENSSHNGWGPTEGPSHSQASSSGWMDQQPNEGYNGWDALSSGVDNKLTEHSVSGAKKAPPIQSSTGIPPVSPADPSAPPIPEDIDVGPIHYPTIDMSPVGVPEPASANIEGAQNDGEGGSSSCIICWEAPVEGACIPCGHMAGCMSCLNEIKGKKGGCPVCRAEISQVVRLYAV